MKIDVHCHLGAQRPRRRRDHPRGAAGGADGAEPELGGNVPRVTNVTALSRLWASSVVMSLTRQTRASACSHDGTGDGCYACAMMLGYGVFLPQSALDELAADVGL